MEIQNIENSEHTQQPAPRSMAWPPTTIPIILLRLRGAHVDKGVLALPVVLFRVQLSRRTFVDF